jgi:hypothetical protein
MVNIGVSFAARPDRSPRPAFGAIDGQSPIALFVKTVVGVEQAVWNRFCWANESETMEVVGFMVVMLSLFVLLDPGLLLAVSVVALAIQRWGRFHRSFRVSFCGRFVGRLSCHGGMESFGFLMNETLVGQVRKMKAENGNVDEGVR